MLFRGWILITILVSLAVISFSYIYFTPGGLKYCSQHTYQRSEANWRCCLLFKRYLFLVLSAFIACLTELKFVCVCVCVCVQRVTQSTDGITSVIQPQQHHYLPVQVCLSVCLSACVCRVVSLSVMLTRTGHARTRTRTKPTRTRTRTRTSLTVTYCKLQLNLQSLSSNNNEHKVKVHNIWL